MIHLLISTISLSSATTSGILQNYYFFPVTSRLIQDCGQLIKTQYSVPYVPTKLIEGLSKMRHLLAPTKTVMHNVTKPAMVYLSTKLAKNSGCSITWKCPQHGTGITEIVMLPPPVYDLPSRPSAPGKSCSIGETPIPLCEFVNPRGTTRIHILSTKFCTVI